MTDAALRQEYRLIPLAVIEDLRRYTDGHPERQLVLLRILMLRLPHVREPKSKGQTTL